MVIWGVTAIDFFFISAGITIWIVLLSWLFIFFKIARIMKQAEIEVKSMKDNLKLTGLNLIGKVLGKGGDINGK